MKRKIFPAIIYFLFTFLVGILIALFLPAIYLYNGVLFDEMALSLQEGRYSDAMALVGGYYNQDHVFEEDLEGGGKIVIFESATITYPEATEDDSEVDENQSVQSTNLQKTYVGFMFGFGDNYQTDKTVGNKTVLKVYSNGQVGNYELLDTDQDENGINDYIGTQSAKGIIIFELGITDYPVIEKLVFVDKDGEEFYQKEFTDKLDFNSDFFNDIEDLLNAYNEDPSSEKAFALNDEFLNTKQSYKISSFAKPQKIANKKATVTVIIYFVCVYILADFILGTHFIIKFVKFVLVKVFKVKPKQKNKSMKAHNQSFGNDYFCAVTVKVDVSEVQDYTEDILISYGQGVSDTVYDNEASKITFTLIAENGYEETLRVKAGTYDNLATNVSDIYLLQDLPEKLIADGYKKIIKVKMLRREE